MPKADRCEQLKKEAAKVRKRVATSTKAAQKALQEKTDLGEVPAEDKAAAARANGSAAGKQLKGMKQADSAFAKAALANQGEEDEEEEEADEAGDEEEKGSPKVQVAERPVDSQAAKGRKEEPPTSGKKKKNNSKRDEMLLLAEEQRQARRQRVIQRFSRFLLVGVAMEMWRGHMAARDEKPNKKKGSSNASRKGGADRLGQVRSVFETISENWGPMLMLVFTIAMLLVRVAEEGYSPGEGYSTEVNFYEALGVQRDADAMTIKKAYKSLALSWHPDKNPGCEACPSRFAKISQAYETLSSPDRRKAYDQQRAPAGSLESMASVDLTAETFETRVLRSNEVWIVEIFNPGDPACKAYHPVWEDVALSHQSIARFGRIDAGREKRALDFLPQRAVLLPVIWRFARGMHPEFYSWSGRDEPTSAQLSRFIMDGYPNLQQFTVASELQAWWETPGSRSKVLVSGPALRGPPAMEVRRLAHLWAQFADVASADVQASKKALKGKISENSWTVTSWVGGAEEVIPLQEVQDVPTSVQGIITSVLSNQAPSVTLRNFQQLCSAGGLGHVTRTFCLLLVDAGDERSKAVAAAIDELKASRTAYSQELQELRNSGEDADEPLHIQPISISTSTSRWPWEPSAAGSAFRSFWAEAAWAPAILVELETRRIAPVKTPRYRDLFQQVAYEDLKLRELPEAISLSRCLPDPEARLRRELSMLLSTILGKLSALVLLAGVAAVLPELSIVTAAGSIVAGAMMLLVVWPGLCRHLIGLLWCTASPSAFECL